MAIKKTRNNKRKTAIQELIGTYAIEDQTTLSDLLKKHYNIETNQAAISRDLRSLGISKQLRGNAMVYALATIDVVTEILRYTVKSIDHNETMIVITTVPGTADFVGDFLDAHHDEHILGTLAGENVIFVVPRSIKNIAELVQQLSRRVKLKE
jgi:transcriptional regulator of arginine metabolism